VKANWNVAKRVAVVAAVAFAGLAGGTTVPSYAAAEAPSATVVDQPGAPRAMLQQLERLAGRPLPPVSKVMAVDTAGKTLTDDQIGALLSGKEVQGVRVLGEIPSSEKALGATMADLSDGRYDGTGGTRPAATSLLVRAADSSDIPDHRDFCLTLCVYLGNGVWKCPWHPIYLP